MTKFFAIKYEWVLKLLEIEVYSRIHQTSELFWNFIILINPGNRSSVNNKTIRVNGISL